MLSVAVLSTVLTGCSDDSKSEDLPAQKLSWKDCPAPAESEGGGNAPSPLPGGTQWQCATMKAPLDWADPKGDTIGIALIRARTSGDQSKRIGSLDLQLRRPRGLRRHHAARLRRGLREAAHPLRPGEVDPRGVGRSAGVQCEDDSRLDVFFQQDATPDDTAEQKNLLNTTKTFNAACEKNSGRTLPHVCTTDAARDIDLMRQVLGDAKLHYFGISYGTELGGVYAHLFPKKVGRAVFDAVVDPTQNPEQSALGQARGFQLALDNFATDCTSKTEPCPIGDTPQDVKNRIAKLFRTWTASPSPASSHASSPRPRPPTASRRPCTPRTSGST